MKKTMLILLILLTGTCFFSTSAFAGWVLYDNFNSGKIKKKLWGIDNSSAKIKIVGGKARFTHRKGTAGDSAYLIVKNPQGVKGIRATVRVRKFKGNCRARVAAWAGKGNSKTFYWQQTEIKPGNQTIQCWIGPGIKKKNSWSWPKDLFYSTFEKPAKVVKRNHKLEINFENLKEIMFGASRFGKTTFYPKIKIKPLTNPDNMFIGIGTRTDNDDNAWIEADFDNVYIYME